MYGVGDVIVPKSHIKEIAHYLFELVIDDIHPDTFMYTVIDLDGDRWQVSPLMIEKDFMLKERATYGD